jgi:hypothetical protein
MYEDTSKIEDTWCAVLKHYRCCVKNNSKLEFPLMGGGMDGTEHNSPAAFNTFNDDRNVNVNRNDNDWNDNWWFVGVRNSLHFSPISPESFVFQLVRTIHEAFFR